MNRPPKKKKNISYPIKPPKVEKIGSIYKSQNCDVKQKDGSIASFTWNEKYNSPDNPEWVFVAYKDKYDFILVNNKTNKEYTDFLLENIVKPENMNNCIWLDNMDPDLLTDINNYYISKGGKLLVYYYNYPMASRGGFVVVSKSDSKKVIAYKQCIMS
jgi:hypothetical protein